MKIKYLSLSILTLFLLLACNKVEKSSKKEKLQQNEKPLIMTEFPSGIIAPKAIKKDHFITQFGEKRNDEYFWMRDDKWQEILKKPELIRDDIKQYLTKENDYYKKMTDDLEPLRNKIFNEMRGRLKEQDDSIPLKDGEYEYFRKYKKGDDYPAYVRKEISSGKLTVLFDAQKASKDEDFFRVSDVSHSPNHKLIAVAIDHVGSEYFDINIHDLDNKIIFKETIKNTGGYVVWNPASTGFYYIQRDDNQRPRKVWYHPVGYDSKDDLLVYEEKNSKNFLSVEKSNSGSFIFISSGNHITNEVSYIPATNPKAKPKVLIARKDGVKYSVQHRGAYFYVLTNDEAVNFKIIRIPLSEGEGLKTQTIVKHDPNVNIDDVDFYADFFVRIVFKNGLANAIISDYDGRSYGLEMDDEAYEISLLYGYEFDTRDFIYLYESPSTPYRAISQNVTSRKQKILKVQEIPSGHDPSLYVVKREFTTALDGAKIPITIIYLKDTKLDGSAPLLLYGYGSYGVKINPGFSSSILSLVDRGVVYAIAHVRGGSVMGEKWYLDGKKEKKINSFTDFNTVAHYMVNAKYVDGMKMCIYGGSAGGLLVGASINLEPDLYKCVIAAVPFVDVLTTISDDTLPLTPPEWDEWGNPITSKEDYLTIKSYSPYDNIKNAPYPAIMATGGLADYRVTYWEMSKWIARLRDKTLGGPVLLKMSMTVGHAGSAARFESMHETSHLYAFALRNLGLANQDPIVHNTDKTYNNNDIIDK